MFEEMVLNAVSFDNISGEPIVVLKNSSRTNSFLVNGENQDIRYLMSEFSGTIADASSPFSLIISIVSSLKGKITRLEIVQSEIQAEGKIVLTRNDEDLSCKCRPIDIVVLSNKLNIPIFISSSLINSVETLYQDNDKLEEKLLTDNKVSLYPELSGEEKEILM